MPLKFERSLSAFSAQSAYAQQAAKGMGVLAKVLVAWGKCPPTDPLAVRERDLCWSMLAEVVGLARGRNPTLRELRSVGLDVPRHAEFVLEDLPSLASTQPWLGNRLPVPKPANVQQLIDLAHRRHDALSAATRPHHEFFIRRREARAARLAGSGMDPFDTQMNYQAAIGRTMPSLYSHPERIEETVSSFSDPLRGDIAMELAGRVIYAMADNAYNAIEIVRGLDDQLGTDLAQVAGVENIVRRCVSPIDGLERPIDPDASLHERLQHWGDTFADVSPHDLGMADLFSLRLGTDLAIREITLDGFTPLLEPDTRPGFGPEL